MAGSGRRSARSRIRSSTDGSEDSSLRGGKPHPRQHRDRSKGYGTIRLLDVDVKVVLVISFFAFVVILFLISNLVRPAEQPSRPRVITPFPAPKLTDLPQVVAFFKLAFLFAIQFNISISFPYLELRIVCGN